MLSGKNAADLRLACVCRFSLHFSRAAFCFGFSHRYAGSVDLHIEDRNGLAHYDGQTQLQSALNLPLVACGDIGSDGFGSTFHRFGRHREAGQQFDLLSSMVEWHIRAHQRQHAANTGRQIRFLYVQSRIGRTLPVMAVRTQIPGAQQPDLAHRSQYVPRTHLTVTGLVTAGTRHFALIRTGRIAPQ